MLFYYPSDRPCARSILDYAWMGNSSRRQKAKDKVIKFLDYRTLLANAKVLRKQSRLVQMVMLYSASKLLTSEEIALARPSFEYIDIDKDGRINRQEVTEAIKKLVNDDNHAIEATKLIFDAVDFNDDQHIEISEFLTMAFDKVVLLSKDRLRRSFETFAKKNESGVYILTAASLWELLKGTTGSTTKECGQMIADVGCGSYLTYEHFVHHCNNSMK